jgi:TetR/AcrR family transcriptional regulator, transcriptional repressor for nem operon
MARVTTTPTATTRDRILDAAQRLVLERGFTATTVDAILNEADVSKGSFFHHFPTKAALGLSLVERYARADEEILENFMTEAESRASDPAGQVVEFLRLFEEAVDGLAVSQPGCLFVSFIYEQVPDVADARPVILDSMGKWQERILEKLEAAARIRQPARPVDLESLADQVFTVFEGGFILARATDDPGRLRAQLAHLRTYLELLFGVTAGTT